MNRTVIAFALYVSFVALGCGGEDQGRPCAGVSLERPVLVLEQSDDHQASALARLDREGCLDEVADIVLGADTLLVEANGAPYVIVDDRGADTLFAIDAEALAIAATYAVPHPEGSWANAHGLGVTASGELWIGRYNLGSLARLDAGGAPVGEVDLADLDPDGVPEMDAVLVRGDRAFVSIERLDPTSDDGVWRPRGPGSLAVLSTSPPYAREGEIPLLGGNPVGPLVSAGGSVVWVATRGDVYAIDPTGGVDAIDLESGVATTIAFESVLGGTVSEVVFAAEDEGYAIVMGPGPDSPTSIVRFDPTKPSDPPIVLASPPAQGQSFVYAGLAVVGSVLVAGNRTRGAAAILLFDRSTGDLLGSVAPRLMPPWSMLSQ